MNGPGERQRAFATSDVSTEIETTASIYLELARGDPSRALQAAVADLLEVSNRAASQQWALDQWVSHGYVQGRAVDHIAAARLRGRAGGASD